MIMKRPISCIRVLMLVFLLASCVEDIDMDPKEEILSLKYSISF